MVRGKDHWFWIIPLSHEKISVGVVMDTHGYRSFRRGSGRDSGFLFAEQPIMREHLSGARRVSKVYASGDYSYRNSSLYGDRWLMAGDAAGFIDPIFSSGVFLAILSGEKAAEAIDGALEAPQQAAKFSLATSGIWPRSCGFILSSSTPGIVRSLLRQFSLHVSSFRLCRRLMRSWRGTLGHSFRAARWRIWLFHLIVAVQRRFHIFPRLSLAPKTS